MFLLKVSEIQTRSARETVKHEWVNFIQVDDGSWALYF